MNQKAKAIWINALRSKKYLQGKGKLFNKDTGKHCALGVLCAESGLMPQNLLEENTALPRAVLFWAGLPYNFPFVRVVVNKTPESISGLNDTGYTFEELADIIEEHL